MDWIWAIFFFLWCEVLSLPLRLALAGWGASGEIARLLSRVSGLALLLVPLWFAAHGAGWVLTVTAGLVWLAAAMWAGTRLGRNGGARGLAEMLGYRAGAGQWVLDALTLLLFLAYVGWRRWVPEMTTYVLDTSAAEKFMNAMIWWSTWHAPALPAEDYWLAGRPLTYYYWGHWFWSWTARVGGFPAELALTLAMARLTTAVFEASVLLARALGLRLGLAIAAGLAATWGGNPLGVALATWPALPGWEDAAGTGFVARWIDWWLAGPQLLWRGYDFWTPSRALGANVISEFPAFSALLGDFHSHHLALPWMLAGGGLLAAGRRWAGLPRAFDPRLLNRDELTRLALLIALAVATIVAAVLTNVWNLPVVAWAAVAATAAWALRLRKRVVRQLPVATASGLALVLVLLGGVTLLRAGEMVPLAPEDGTGGLPVRPLPPELRSTPVQLWRMWGFVLLPVVVTGWVRLWRRFDRRAALWWMAGWLAAVAGARWHDASPGGSWGAWLPWGAAWVWFGAACWGVALTTGRGRWLTRRAAGAWVAGCVVLAGLETVFIDDALSGEYERYNTYFKLAYPVWPVMMIVAAQAVALPLLRRVAWPGRGATTFRAGWGALAAVWALLLAVYPMLAATTRMAGASADDWPPRRPTLHAFDFLHHEQRPDLASLPYFREAEMLDWIRAHVPPGDTVAEAAWVTSGETYVGGYDFNGRVASLAGRPVPLGWAHHERQWRGPAAHAMLLERQHAIDRLYMASTSIAAREAAAELGVRWVLYGVLEHDRYAVRGGLGPRVLNVLGQAGRLAAAFPREAPAVFLFDFRPEGSTVVAP